ncbi:MAG: hypothetical protein ACP5TE_09670 [Verrucomicrobiia bacterium]
MKLLSKFLAALIVAIGIGFFTQSSFSQDAFTINGVSDKSVATSFTINIPVQSGYGYFATLNGNRFPVGTNVLVNSPDYYELVAFRTNLSSGVVTNRLVRFIVRSAERGNTEDGIPPWTPYPVIPSCDDEFVGGHLHLIVPRRFPAGYQIPIVAWIMDEQLHPLRVNGFLKDGNTTITIRRGVGSGFIPAQSNVVQTTYSPIISTLSTNIAISIETNVNWIQVSGTISQNTTWQANARIYITTNLTIAAGATLTIEKGTVIRINYRTDITNNGTVVINGTTDEPVVFMPNSPSQPWGGFVMRQVTGEIVGTGVIFTGSGAEPNWFGSNGNPGSHRKEQALFFVGNNQRITLTDSAAIYMAGQLGHSVSGGIYNFTRFLMQRATTGGEFTGAAFTMNDCALIECPDDTANFVDGDNDAIYIVNGNHGFTNTLFGWTKDDGVDSGGSGAGILHFSNCWFEATFHEGNSLSGNNKDVYHWNDVFIGCGQGLEAGYDGPHGYMIGCLAVNNVVGGRFGDNYDWTYTGSITISNSILIHNYHDVWGMNWQTNDLGWIYRTSAMTVVNNLLTAPNTNHPNNAIYNPQTDSWRLAKFGAKGRAGIGFAVRSQLVDENMLSNGIPVGLSKFCTNPVAVDYIFEGPGGVIQSGSLGFEPGEVLKKVSISQPISGKGIYRLSLSNPINGDVTGIASVYLKPTSSQTLIAQGSVWKYLDDGSNQGVAWRELNFNDSSWKSGAAELGFGDGDEKTVINRYNANNQQIITYYFRRYFVINDPSEYSALEVRLRRDDGGIVYINGVEVFRSNMPSGTNITYTTTSAGNAADDGNSWFSTNAPATMLVSGTNVCAVEIHQANSTSSDVTFELELIGMPKLRANILKFNKDIVVYWEDPTAILEKAEKITGPWTPVGSQNGLFTTQSSGMEFYRLRK